MGGRGGSSGFGHGLKASGLPKLEGSEKQIQWAEQIRQDAINAINGNIALNKKRLKEYPGTEKIYKPQIEAYQEIGRQLNNALNQITSAAQLIDRRNVFDPSRIIKEATKMAEKKRRK